MLMSFALTAWVAVLNKAIDHLKQVIYEIRNYRGCWRYFEASRKRITQCRSYGNSDQSFRKKSPRTRTSWCASRNRFFGRCGVYKEGVCRSGCCLYDVPDQSCSSGPDGILCDTGKKLFRGSSVQRHK